MAPYQILLNETEITGAGNAIWAPADIDEIIRAGFRFRLTDECECRVDVDEWARCTVVGLLYREKEWPDGRYAPYQVQVTGLLPGALSERAQQLAAAGLLIWLPDDSDEYIRRPCAVREERLQALHSLRASGVISEDEHAEKRKEAVHAPGAAT